MHSSKTSRSRAPKTRDYDAESGKNRVKGKKSRRPPPPPESSTESEVSASESEIESEYEIKVKDVHRQRPAPARPRKVRPQQDMDDNKPGEEPPANEETNLAPGFDFLVALAYRQGTSAVQFETRSYYVPDCRSLFSAAFFICTLLAHNTLVHEFDPAFMSITFYLYTGHLFYYQILRIRDTVGELTREERRCLRHYENVGPAEAWPVPTPFIGILSSLGSVQPPSKYYGKLIPKLPSFANFTAAHSLRGLENVVSIVKMPIIPAMQQFLRNFGSGTADFDPNGILHPIADPALTAGAAGPPVVPPNTFLGLNDSTATGHAQTLFFSSGWNLPTETSEEMMNFPHAQKRALVNRFNVPNIGETTTITGIESFLGFRDGQSNAWMRKLLSNASTVTRFFPGSVNLSAIGTTSQEELISTVAWSVAAARNAVADQWYRGRNLWTYSIDGKVNTENSGYLYKAAASSSTNMDYSVNLLPVAAVPVVTYSAERTGPYFADPAGTRSRPLTLVEIVGQPDPTRNMLTFMDEKLYDNLGGRARS